LVVLDIFKRERCLDGLGWYVFLFRTKQILQVFGNPAVMAFSALDPWLCVLALQRVCPFALYP